MKKIILLFAIFLAGCTGHHSANDFDLIALNEIAPILLNSKTVNGVVEKNRGQPKYVS